MDQERPRTTTWPRGGKQNPNPVTADKRCALPRAWKGIERWGWQWQGCGVGSERGKCPGRSTAPAEVDTYLPSSCQCLPPPSWGCWKPSSQLGIERRGNCLSQHHHLVVCVPTGWAPTRAVCPPLNGWHLGWAPPPQGTAAQRGQGWRHRDRAPQLTPAIQPQPQGSRKGQCALPCGNGNCNQGGDHLPLTVPRGLCKTEKRG